MPGRKETPFLHPHPLPLNACSVSRGSAARPRRARCRLCCRPGWETLLLLLLLADFPLFLPPTPFPIFPFSFFFFPFPLFLGFFSAFPFPSPGTGLEASHSVCNTHHLQQINKTDLSLFGTSNLKGFCPVWPCFMPICSSPQSPLAWHLQDLSSSLSGRFCIQYFAKVPSKSISLFPVFILACWGWEMLVQKSLQHENSFLVS